jgi:hypothetical protein
MSNNISDAIKAIVLSGGTVEFPWKRGIKSWFSEIKISTVGTGNMSMFSLMASRS